MVGEMPASRSVRDFKRHILVLAGFAETSVDLFCQQSIAHAEFILKLNNIGWQKRTAEPEITRDVDSTAFLNEKEWSALEEEFKALQPGVTGM